MYYEWSGTHASALTRRSAERRAEQCQWREHRSTLAVARHTDRRRHCTGIGVLDQACLGLLLPPPLLLPLERRQWVDLEGRETVQV